MTSGVRANHVDPGRILLAVDGSAAAAAATKVAARVALGLRAQVAVLYVDHARSRRKSSSSPDRDAVVELTRRGVKAAVEVRAGDPGDEILAASRDLASKLIVIGSRGRSSIGGLLLGSVSQQVTAGATCPVLLVPSSAGEPPTGKILLAIEGGVGLPALTDTCADLASALGAAVVVVHVSYPGGEEIERDLYHAQATHGEQAVESAVARLAERGVRAMSLSVSAADGISRALARCAASVDAQLIVMGAHDPARPDLPAGIGRATSVARRSRRPVVVVRERDPR